MQRLLGVLLVLVLWVDFVLASSQPPYPENNWAQLSKLLADKNMDPEWRTPDGRSIVLLQMQYGSESTAVEMLKRAKRVKVWREGTGRLMTAAVTHGSQQIVATLLSFGESANAVDPHEEPPLLEAAALGELEIMRMLLRSGANIYATRPGTAINAMDLAMERGALMAIDVLIDGGFDLAISRRTEMDKSLVLRALEGHCIDCIEILSRAKFDFSHRRSNGETPLTYAVLHSVREGIVDFLLSSGADPCVPNASGKLPEQLAVPLDAQDLAHLKPTYVLLENECNKSKLRRE